MKGDLDGARVIASDDEIEAARVNYKRVVRNGRRVWEHRWLMEQKLGRKLETWEEVHHIDRDATNNRLDNLVVLVRKEHVEFRKKQREVEGTKRQAKEKVCDLSGKLVVDKKVSRGWRDIPTLKQMQAAYRRKKGRKG